MADGVKRVRGQFKANATRVLRHWEKPIQNEKVWTKGGDIQSIDSDDDLELVVVYITEAQDRMDRGKSRADEPAASALPLTASVRRDHQDPSRLGGHEDQERRSRTKIKNGDGKEVGYNHEDGATRIIMTGNATDAADIQQHVFTKRNKKRLEKRFKDPDDPLKIVIVRDMWLTGFDAPCCHTMHVDKPMSGHNRM